MLGWMFDVMALKSIMPGFTTMKPNSALGFILCGSALFLFQLGRKSENQNLKMHVSQVLGGGAGFIGFLTLAEYNFGLNPGIDTLLFENAVRAENIEFPGRMSPVTSFNFVISAAALIMINTKKNKAFLVLSQVLALILLLLSVIVFIAYSYEVEALYKVYPFISVALHSAIGFFVLGVCILFSWGSKGLTSVFSLENAGGLISRRLIPLALILPFIIG